MRLLVDTVPTIISRSRWAGLWLGTVWCLCFTTAAVDVHAQPDLPNQRSLSPDDRAWLHLYVRDRRLASALDEARHMQEQSRPIETAAHLQYVLDQSRDAWTLETEGELTSIRQQVLDLLSTPVMLQTYRRTVGPDAMQELARARASQETADFLRVVRVYFPTPAAYEAAEWLMRHWLDDGNWQLSATLALQFADSPFHRGYLTPRFRRMAVVACELAGRPHAAERFRRELSQTAQAQPGGVVPNAVSSALLVPSSESPLRSPPVLEPRWSHGLESSRTQLNVEAGLAEWAGTQREHEGSTAVGWIPVLADNLLVFRELDLIRAVDLRTGNTVWRYRTQSNLGNLLKSKIDDRAQQRHRSQLWEAAASNSLLNGLTTDGQRVFGVEASDLFTLAGVYGLESQWLPYVTRQEAVQNELVALNLWSRDDEPRIAWQTSTMADAAQLRGHAFLGPPLAVGGNLFVLSESDRELMVTALTSASGRVLWQQPIAESERSLVEERGRNIRAVRPIAVNDLIICPTQIGLLVAVDQVTGGLRWAHNSLETPAQATQQRFRTVAPLTQRRHAAFPSVPVATGDAIVYLPSQSDRLYCLEAATGRVRWSVAQTLLDTIVHADAEQVVVLGKTVVRAYAMQDGQPQWVCSLPGVVSGQGTLVSTGYLVPLESGQVVTVDLRTGRSAGFRFDSPPQPVGHLIATATDIISVGAHGVSAFPQTHQALAELQVAAATQPGVSIKIAEVRLAEGNLHAAVQALEAAWPNLKTDAERQRARQLLWESYFQLVRDDPDQVDLWLERLEPLVARATPAEQVRWLVVSTARNSMLTDADRLTQQFLQLAELSNHSGLIEAPGDRDLEVSAQVWLQMLLQRLADDPQQQDLQRALADLAHGDPESPAAVAAARVVPHELAASLRRQQAAAAVQSGDWQRAAILLQRTSHSRLQRQDDSLPIDAVPAEHLRDLARLLTAAVQPGAAAFALDRYRRSQAIAMADFDPRRVLGDLEAAELTVDAWQRKRPIDWSIERVQVRSRLRTDAQVTDFTQAATGRPRQHAPYEDFQRSIGSVAPEASLEWMLRNTERGTEIGVFDKLSSQKLFESVLPFGASPPSTLGKLSDPMLVPFSLPGEIRALSPLQGNRDFLAWQIALPEWTRRSGQALCGPATNSIACFQWKHVLLVVDPADGRLLWRRNDIEPNSGIYADSRIGLLADDDVVFVLGADKSSYRILDAATGQQLRQGTLLQDVRFARYELGGKILHLQDEVDQRRIRVWDPNRDELLLDDSLRSRQLFSRISDDAVAWLTADSRLRVFSCAAGRITVDVQLTADDIGGVATLKVAEINGWHYVSIGRNQPLASTTHFQMPIQDKLIPGESFRDALLAIGPEGKEVQWRRTIPQRTLLQPGTDDLPFLIAACLVRDKRDPNRRWLKVEVFDRETGHLLGMGDHLPNDRLLHVDYDGPSGMLRLIGRRTEIELDFSRAIQPTPAQKGWF